MYTGNENENILMLFIKRLLIKRSHYNDDKIIEPETNYSII